MFSCGGCPGLGMDELLRIGMLKSILLKVDPMADITTNTLLNEGKCFQCYGLSMAQVMEMVLLSKINDNVTGDIVNVQIPFTLVSGTTDTVVYTLPVQGIGWYYMSFTWFVNGTPGAWGGAAAELEIDFSYDVEDNVGLTDVLDTFTPALNAGIPPGAEQNGNSLPYPVYFAHAQQPTVAVTWNVAPNAGETVTGFLRFILKRNTFS